MRKVIVVAGLLWLISAALTGFAQVDTATIVGTVRDATGAVVPSATVTATAIDTGIKTTVKSGPDGDYVLTPLKIGRYSVSATASGFQTEARTDIVLNVQQRQRLDFSLKVGSVSQTTEVSGQPPQLETESASLGDVVAAQQVEELPLNGRRYTDLGELSSGVTKVI